MPGTISQNTPDQHDNLAHQHGLDRLQSLPPEVRHHLLSLLGLSRLKAIVHDSPIFHQHYLYDRNYILCSSLEHTLRGAAVDALAATMLSKPTSSLDETLVLVKELHSSDPRLVGKLTEEEAVAMAVLYSTAQSVTEHFASWVLDDLARLTGSQQEMILSSTENLRFMRTSYRFQILCRLADLRDRSRRTAAKDEAILPFLGLLEPWEIEELFSFYQFVQSVYSKILDDIRLDVHPDNPRFDDQDRLPTPEGAFEIDNYGRSLLNTDLNINLSRLKQLTLEQVDRKTLLEGTALRGFALLNTVLFRVQDHEDLISTMQQHMARSYIGLDALTGILGEAQQTLRRQTHPSERDKLQDERAPCSFSGDIDERMKPPAAWAVIWGDTYSNLVGWYIPDKIRRWGYVFWDAPRIESIGGRELLKQQFEEAGDDVDPRDNLM